MRATAEALIAAIREADETIGAGQDCEASATIVANAVRDAFIAWATDAVYDMGGPINEIDHVSDWFHDVFEAAVRVAACREAERRAAA